MGAQGAWASDPRVVDLMQLRHHIAHLLTNLQVYVQVRMGGEGGGTGGLHSIGQHASIIMRSVTRCLCCLL